MNVDQYIQSLSDKELKHISDILNKKTDDANIELTALLESFFKDVEGYSLATLVACLAVCLCQELCARLEKKSDTSS